MQDFDTILDRHERIALQLSGGRDSIACLYLLRPWLERITVYWNNTGAAFPETRELIDQLRALCPNFIEINGDQPGHIARHGIPSDLVPSARTPIGLMGAGSDAPAIQDRYTCCANVIMIPLHARMIDDDITLIIRGQKNSDALKGPLRSGMIDERDVEYLFPIEDWTGAQVMDYLRAERAPIPRFYEIMNSAPDCMTCSAYWEEGAAAYLKRYHHPEYLVVQARLDIIREATGAHIAAFNTETAP
jgi:3'-phosphoadenosine 5'-phosphosulfate sulfotransferase (PAPS reductase)/FAD synthetase